MRVILFETTNATPHIETSLELAKKHIDQGDDVSFYFLGHAVPFVEFVRRKVPLLVGCLPERKGKKLLSGRLNYIEPSISSVEYESVVETPFSSSEELQSFQYKTHNAGLSALSSLISRTCSSKPDISEHSDLIKKILISGISTYEFVLSEIDNKKPDLIYLFNGRFAVNRAILDAAIEKGVPFKIHERGANKSRYTCTPWMPHDFARIKEAMLVHWDRSMDSQKAQIAEQFFLDRRQGQVQGWKSFLAHQEKNHLPALPTDKRVLAYFSSSDDEYAAVGDIVKWDRWPDQMTAVKELIELVAKHPELYLVIRLHPHKVEKHPLDLEEWLSIDFPRNATLIRPEDPVDTYSLSERADVVVTSGSTTGIESVFWRTPSICLGPSLYSHLDAVYLPVDKNELERMIVDNSLQADPLRTLPYGYYMATFGEEFVYYKPETLFSGKFMGVNLQSFGLCKYLRVVISLPVRVFRKISKFVNRRINHA